MNRMTYACAVVCALAGMAFGDVAPEAADGVLRESHAKETSGLRDEAVKGYEGVFRSAELPSHQRLAALCGLIRSDDGRLAEWLKAAWTSGDDVWRGTAAQTAAQLPAKGLDCLSGVWLVSFPVDEQIRLLRAMVHVKSPAARRFIQEALAKSQTPALRHEALEGLGRTGTAADVDALVTWMQSEDDGVAAAARRGLISIGDVKADAFIVMKLPKFDSNPEALVKLLDVLTVRNALGYADQIAPFLRHTNGAVRTQAFKSIAQQGGYDVQEAVLAAAAKIPASARAERKEARRAVMKIARRAGGVQFKARRIGSCRTEACGVADFDGDGKPDVVAGPYLYLAPEFRPARIRDVAGKVGDDGKGYAHDFMNLPLDVDGDGKPDVVSGDWFSKETWWFRNLMPTAGLWPRHVIEKTGNIETGILVDVDGDGKATDLLPDTQVTCLYRLGDRRPKVDGFFSRDSISNEGCDMGRGCGDLNGDGRNDVLTPAAWYEQLENGGWKKHPLRIGFDDPGRALGHASNIIVYDVDKDGLNDVIVSSAHKYGIFWWRQLKERDAQGELRFEKHVIDDTWTQAHYLGWGDVDNDGVPELVTGKRFMAHNGGDPDEYGPLGVYYYDFTPGPDPAFRKYVVSYDSDVGVGLNVECVDMDGDGDLDLVTTGKWGGPVIFENKLK